MNSNIYKSLEGQQIIEKYYTGILSNYSVHNFESLYVDTDIAKTHVLRFGKNSNPPLFMFHGSTSNSATWLGCISHFINDFCIYCVDIPGEPGLSEPVRCELNTDEPLRWMVSLLDNMHIDRTFMLGMSLGSWYAMNFALNKPQRLYALSMITAGGFAPMKKSFILKAILSFMLGDFGKKMLNKAIYYKTKVPDEVLYFQSITAAHFNPVMEPLPLFTDEQLKKVSLPLQFFGGYHDGLINSVRAGNRIKMNCLHADVHLIKNTGHVILDQFDNIYEFFRNVNI